MNKVADILSRKGNEAISVTPETSVLEALRIMAENNIGSIVVKNGERLVGIITERDYSRKVILKGKNSNNTQVSEIMTTEFPPVKPSDSVEYCMALMTKHNIRYLPVFKDNQLSGIISMSDVVKETILAQQETINQLENYIHSNV